MRNGGRWVTLALVVVVLGGLAWLLAPQGPGVPLSPRDTSSVGTAGLVALLDELGVDVAITATPPADAGAVLVVLSDRLEDQRDDIRGFVERGGRLVLVDPQSPLNPFEVVDVLVTDLFGATSATASCDLLDGVADEAEADAWLALAPTPDATVACYPVGRGFGLVAAPMGAGEVVVLGAPGVVVNGAIGAADHARLAVAIIAPTGQERVEILWDATIGAGDVELLDLVPRRARLAFWILVAAAGVYAVARARRVGAPVAEDLPVRVPGSELVLAIGDLLARHGHRDAAAARLRSDLRRDLAAVLHVAHDTPADVLVELASHRLGVDRGTLVTAILDAPTANDDALLAVGRAAAATRAATRSARDGHG